jgi:hypothetical protein
MSKSEAEEYTRDSYYREQDFYHGTSRENANGITITGAKWEQDSENTPFPLQDYRLTIFLYPLRSLRLCG